jgi:hypothetical protein
MENENSYNQVLDDIRREEKFRQIEWEKMRLERDRQASSLMAKARENLFPCLREATVSEYQSWLAGFIKNGGRPTHCYQYPMPSSFKVAKRDFETISLFGSQSVEIIVPVGVNFFDDGLGHCNLYLMNGFKVIGGWVPVYSDI